MKIQKSIAKRIEKTCKLKPVIATPFFQNGYEHVTNTFYAVRVPVVGVQTITDRPDTPIMSVVYNQNQSKEEGMRFDIQYLREVLTILEDNGAKYVDLYRGERALVLKGYNNSLGQINTGDAVIMKVNK